jgi:hypothetical protein
MSTLNKYFNARINPFTGEKEPKHIVAGDANSDYPFIQSPETYNAPENAPIRVEIELPEIPDFSDTVNRPFLLYKDSIAPANRLTQVSGEPTTDNTYRVGLAGLERSHCLQLSENLMDTPIYFDYYGLGTVLNKSNLENLIVDYLKVNNDVVCENLSADDIYLSTAFDGDTVYVGANGILESGYPTKNQISAGLNNLSDLTSDVNDRASFKTIAPGVTVALISSPNPVIYTDWGCKCMVVFGNPIEGMGTLGNGAIVSIDKSFSSPVSVGDWEFIIDDDPVLKTCTIYLKNNSATVTYWYRTFKPTGYPL